MNRGDKMRNGAEPSAVRILPAPGAGPAATPASAEQPAPKRWFAPLLVAVGVLAVFVLATRPAGVDPNVSTTEPARMAAVVAEPIDLTTQPVTATVGDWTDTSFGYTGQINDVVRMSVSFVAVGATPDGGAKVWLSGNGGSWRELDQLEASDSSKTSLDHVVRWDGGVLALGSVDDGVGVWTAALPSTWVYHGRVAAIDRPTISGLAAGKELLAISTADQTVRGWMSTDGLDWQPLPQLDDLIGSEIHTLAATEEWYFAGGRTCDTGGCRPVIYRSVDGLTWEESTARLAAEDGAVMDMTATPTGLLAVGTVGRHPASSIAVWRSEDGSSWEQIGVASPAFSPPSITVEVLAIRPGDNPSATLGIDGSEYEVTVGTELLTDVGSLPIGQILDSYLVMGEDWSRRRVALATPTTISLGSTVSQITAEGPRIVIAGSLLGENGSAPAMWASADSGASWERTVQPVAQATVTNVALGGSAIVAVTDGHGPQPLTWRTTWDTKAVAAVAVGTLEDYLAALEARDPHALVTILPQFDDGPTDARFEVPSLGGTVPAWWDTDNYALDPTAVATTVDYLTATDVSIEVGECTSGVSLGTTDRINVGCDYTVNSALLTIFGLTDADGRAQAVFRDGELVSVQLDPAPSEQVWHALVPWAKSAGLVDSSAAGGVDPADFQVVFDATTAPDHIALAEDYIAGLLLPGETRTVETAFGIMEWTWTTPPAGVGFGSVTWSDLGFIASGFSHTGATDEPEFSLWVSPDGGEWSELAVLDGLDGVWNLQPFGSGIVGQASQADTAALVYFDGTEWTEIPFPKPAEADYLDLTHLAVGGDRILAMAGWWSEGVEPIFLAHLIGPDLVPHLVDLPSEASFNEVNVELAGSDDGFLLATSAYSDIASLAVWHTENGDSWTLLTESAPLDDAQFVWNLQHHRSRYFVVGEGAELRCSNTAQGEACASLLGLWSSPDGTTWQEVLTSAGEPIATYEIGSGPLGLVAIGQELVDAMFPRAVYTSVNGSDWDLAGNLAMLDPNATWWWPSQPAISDDTVVIAGFGYRDAPDITPDEPFLIVGRVIEP